jgi:hypothetical protein
MVRILGSALVIVLLALAVFGPDASADRLSGSDHGGQPLAATLTGEAEVNASGVPNQGDLDGTGSARVTFNHGQGEVCFELVTDGIAIPTRGHIHRGPAGTNGLIVVDFFNGNTEAGPLSGCVDGVSRALIKEITKNPSGFYFNVHNADFPGGAMRGQLG